MKIMKAIKFHKTFGQVEVINSDETTTTIIVVETGEEKKLATKYAFLSDEPFAQIEKRELVKSKPVKKELTAEQKIKRDRRHAAFMSKLDNAILNDNFLPSQIESGNYNKNLIK